MPIKVFAFLSHVLPAVCICPQTRIWPKEILEIIWRKIFERNKVRFGKKIQNLLAMPRRGRFIWKLLGASNNNSERHTAGKV